MSTNPDDKFFFHHLPNPIVRILGGKGGSLEPCGCRIREDYVYPHRQNLFTGISSLRRDLLAMSRDLEMPHFSQRDLERG